MMIFIWDKGLAIAEPGLIGSVYQRFCDHGASAVDSVVDFTIRANLEKEMLAS